MEVEELAFRIGMFALFLTLALMSWAVSVQAADSPKNSPCSFNLLCTCSKPGPSEYGIVECEGVPFKRIPTALNSSRAFVLSLKNNGLELLEKKQFVGSGLWRLSLRDNLLYYVDPESFWGLGKFLTELELENNALVEIPKEAIRPLGKLRVLNLGGNQITDLEGLAGLPQQISCLSLQNNLLTNVPQNAFTPTPKLERLDLSRNGINFIDSESFSGLPLLSVLLLRDNLLSKVPIPSLLPLAKLSILDLSANLITQTFDPSGGKGAFVLESLNLDSNLITSLPAFSFQNFKGIRTLQLSKNPLTTLGDEAFKGSGISTLHLSNNYLTEVYPRAFRGLEASLKTLDLGYNNLTYLPISLLHDLRALKDLVLDENVLEMNGGSLSPSLQSLSLRGGSLHTSMEDLKELEGLRTLSLGWLQTTSITGKLFEELGSGSLTSLQINWAKVNTLMNGAFSPLVGLKTLDLSGNRIGRFAEGALEGLEHSLKSLKLVNTLKMSSFPWAALQSLGALEELDMSGNGLGTLPKVFAFGNLKHFNFRWNKLQGIMDFSKAPKLKAIDLGFNQLKEVRKGAFARLRELERLELNENLLAVVQRGGFEDLTNLKVLDLAGNNLIYLEDASFANLPQLEVLDLSYNSLSDFNLAAFVQLGTLSSSSHLNLSHNNLQSLFREEHHEDEALLSSSSVEYLDLSHNNITYISPNFFAPNGHTLLTLDMSYNGLGNLSKGHLTSMTYLQNLKLSHNELELLEYDSFSGSRKIQLIYLDHNALRDLPPDIFEKCDSLRVLTLANNKLRSLGDALFKDTRALEYLELGHNALVRFPEAALTYLGNSLLHLDLEGNEISSLSPSQLECLSVLKWLSVANNRIFVLGDTSFDHLALSSLDLSGNPLGKVNSRFFFKLRDSLRHLSLANSSLTFLPELDTFPHLLSFDLSHNSLTFLPTNFGVNVSSLRKLELSGNLLASSPTTLWHTIARLSFVSLSGNPISSLANDSFLGLEYLTTLDLSHLEALVSVQNGALSSLPALRHLSIGPLNQGLTLSPLIQNVESLQSLSLKLDVPMMSVELKGGPLPPKLSKIKIMGPQLMSITDGALSSVSSRSLTLTLEDTSLADLGEGVVQQLGAAETLRLEIGRGNPILKSVGNPNAKFAPKPFVPYLTSLTLDVGSLSCSCDSGWVEFWLREWMQEMCPSQQCEQFLAHLRGLECENKLELGLLGAFVGELECGWESGGKKPHPLHWMLIISIYVVTYF